VNWTCTVGRVTLAGMELEGIYVPLVTPFGPDGAVATGALAELAYAVLDDGAAGVVALGTTAEAATLDAGERRSVVEVCARVCRERGATLIVGAGSNDTRASAAALSALGERPEVSAALVPVPYYTRPAQAGVLAHFTTLAAQSPVPLLVYHIPHRTGQELSAATLRRLAEHPRIVGVKYAVGGVDEDAMALLADPPEDFAVLAGEDAFAAPMLALGAAGGILAAAHLATRRYADLVEAWRGGEVDRARALGRGLTALAAALFAAPNPTVIKGALHASGRIPTATVRLPLLPAPAALVDGAVAAAGRIG
jgi:4-hydroxy-tetrahydrodipicolinate synthase